MPRAVVLRVLGIASALLVLSGGGYAGWAFYVRHTQTVQQLEATQAALTKRQETLTLLEQEQQKLSQDYETLKGRWASSDAELQRVTKASAQMTMDLDRVTDERTSLQAQLSDAKAQTDQLRQRASALEQTRAALVDDKQILDTKLQAAATASRAQSERVERLQRMLNEQETQAQQLHDQILEVSHAYEQLAQERAAEPGSRLAQISAQPLRPPTAAEMAMPHPTAPSATAEPMSGQAQRAADSWGPPSTLDQVGQFLKDLWSGTSRGGPEGKRLARAYRQMGESFANVQEYQKAAQAFERSLRFRDDPAVHQELALLYSQGLHDPGLAALHAQAGTRRPPAQPSSNGLPRKSWRLVFDWLMQR